ncbi:MAG: Rrf2 family transcriptional regulator [Kiritimatiellae bacterium]|nr:Rrf2 family transcriptional regulator [Kiritimatiellia bacterium]
MRISSRSRYALLTVLDLTIQRSAGVSKVHDIARRQQIPQKFLEQILLVLKSGGLVASKRGAKGGYLLKKEPETISVADVLALTEDAVMATEEDNNEGANQIFAEVWTEINTHVSAKLAGLDFQELHARAEKAQESQLWQYTI